ncbi:MAG: [ribosomal protein S5]-alanine N-acetyltransferase [Actinomycetota bacterium]|jgi:ribosomal-protein-alanine N-acetyltransferase|nr:[ribosomal protein S5]-alanine N-acetyltransferase [Actinomycetota bacterium]MEA2447887.1 [ribosomal protein S5]-alanine N-acetyltransferase [Actinomycetota bacterium]
MSVQGILIGLNQPTLSPQIFQTLSNASKGISGPIPIPYPNQGGGAKGFSVATDEITELKGRRIVLRPLTPADFEGWTSARQRNEGRLGASAYRGGHMPDPTESPEAFDQAWRISEIARHFGTDHHFGIFLGDELVGEAFLSGVLRGPLQSGFFGKWIDGDNTRQGYSAEAFVLIARYAFDELELQRIEIPIDPANDRMIEVFGELGARNEGVAHGYVLIGDEWRDQYRFAFTRADWDEHRDRLVKEYLED